MKKAVYSGYVKLHGEEHDKTISAALNYAVSLLGLKRFVEAKELVRKTMPVARRVLGTDNYLTLQMRSLYAHSLYADNGATLDDVREAVTTLEDTERIARRVLGSAHPIVCSMERTLREARAALAAREGTKIK